MAILLLIYLPMRAANIVAAVAAAAAAAATATFPNYSLMRNLDYSLSNEPKFKFVFLLEAEISKLQNWSNKWQNVQYGLFDLP